MVVETIAIIISFLCGFATGVWKAKQIQKEINEMIRKMEEKIKETNTNVNEKSDNIEEKSK